MTARHAHGLRAALAAGDALAAIAAGAAAYYVRLASGLFPVQGRTDVLPERYAAALPAAVLLLLFATAAAGLYDQRRLARAPAAADVVRLAGFGIAALATVTLLYWSEFSYSRSTIFATAVVYAPLCALFRRAELRILRSARRGGAAGALVVGGGRPAAALESALAEQPWVAANVTAVLPVGPCEAFAGRVRFPSWTEALAALDEGRFVEVFVAVPADSAAQVPEILARLDHSTVDVRWVPDLGTSILVNAQASLVGGLPVLSLRERPLDGLRAAVKRAVDVALATSLLLVLSPLLVALAVLVRLTSPGPALYAQERVGIDGKSFAILKFRTMRHDAEALTGPTFARPGDPRTTSLGRFLRRFSLDELPQLWNVVRGDMSLVGPRPERAPFIQEFRRRLPGYMLRHTVKSGMTGWAQVHGLRGDTSVEERLRYDLEYVDRWSLSLDLEILGRTAIQVLVGRNAY